MEDAEIDVLDLSPDRVGMFDIVLFLGALYHMKHPILALERVASVTNRLLVVETVIDLLYLPAKALAYYPGSNSAAIEQTGSARRPPPWKPCCAPCTTRTATSVPLRFADSL